MPQISPPGGHPANSKKCCQNGEKSHIGEKLHQTTRKGKPKPSNKAELPTTGERRRPSRTLSTTRSGQRRRGPDQRATEERAKVRDKGEQDAEKTPQAQTDQRQHQGKLRLQDPEHEEETEGAPSCRQNTNAEDDQK